MVSRPGIFGHLKLTLPWLSELQCLGGRTAMNELRKEVSGFNKRCSEFL